MRKPVERERRAVLAVVTQINKLHKLKKVTLCDLFVFWCGRWDLNPQGSNIHRCLRPARLPVPSHPHILILLDNNIILKDKSQAI